MNDKNMSRRTCLKLLGASALALHSGFTQAGSNNVMTKKIPSSGETIPVIGLGTSRVFDVGQSSTVRLGAKEVMAALSKIENSMVDTSPMYGRAEEVTGDLGAELGIRKQLFYATKVWTEGKEAGIAEMNESMRLLKTDKLDLIQIHNLLDWETHLKTLRDWKAEEKVRYIGITHYNEFAHDAVEKVLKTEPLDFMQINYSLLEPESANRLLPLAQDRGVAVIINRPFARGQLFRMTKGTSLPGYANELGINTWAQFFLKFVVSHPAVTVAIPGTSKLKHMIDNQNGGRGPMPDSKTRQAMLRTIQQL